MKLSGGTKNGLCVGLTALALALLAPAAALAEPELDCKGSDKATANFKRDKGHPNPLAIGDSTMSLPIRYLPEVGYDVNARGCRGMNETVQLVKRLLAHGRLPHLVTVAVGSNGAIQGQHLDTLVKLMGPDRVLVLVKVIDRDGGPLPKKERALIDRTVKRNPRNALKLDWYTYAQRNPDEWLDYDHWHPTFEGAKVFAKFLARGLKFSKTGSLPGGRLGKAGMSRLQSVAVAASHLTAR